MYFRPASHVSAALLATVSLIAAGRVAQAQAFNQFIGFGDSTIDTGWYFTHTYNTNPINEAEYKAAQAAGGGVATTIGGPMNSQVLASSFGLTAIPVGEPGGTNYAAGGAVNVDYAGYQTLAPTTVSQILKLPRRERRRGQSECALSDQFRRQRHKPRHLPKRRLPGQCDATCRCFGRCPDGGRCAAVRFRGALSCRCNQLRNGSWRRKNCC